MTNIILKLQTMTGSSSQQQMDFETQLNSEESVIATDGHSTTDEKPVITFNDLGQIVHNKTKLLNRTLVLLKVQVGLEYNDWRQVNQFIKEDMWETLKNKFEMPLNRKDDILKEIGVQLETWQ